MAREERPASPPLRTCKRRDPSKPDAEVTLDGLLVLHKKRRGDGDEPEGPMAPTDPVGALRARFVEEFIPVFQEIADKYSEQGVSIQMDVGDFFSGGRDLIIDIQFEDRGLRLHGTVLSNRIAFEETRYMGNIPGAVDSGPSLSMRGLRPSDFRRFVCGRIGDVVRTVLRQTMKVPGRETD